MNNNDGVPYYKIRGLTLWGFRDRTQFIDYLFASGRLKTGTLIAINAEKVLNAEQDAVLKSLLEEAEYKYKEGVPVFFVGGRPEVLIQTEAQLRARWNVIIACRQDGYFSLESQPALLERICASRASIVTVAMGSPRQERLMQECRQVHPHALYMGVGGTYDVFTGYVKRAPKSWQDWGLEWFYRLLSEPSRLQRQLKLLRYLRYHISRRL